MKNQLLQQAKDLQQKAQELLNIANAIGDIVLCSLPPMIDSLSTADYHKIRDNLGLTSGSHSVNLHYHLFRDLYGQLAINLEQHLIRIYKDITNIEGIVLHVDSNRYISSEAFLHSRLIDDCLNLQQFLQQFIL